MKKIVFKNCHKNIRKKCKTQIIQIKNYREIFCQEIKKIDYFLKKINKISFKILNWKTGRRKYMKTKLKVGEETTIYTYNFGWSNFQVYSDHTSMLQYKHS